MTEAAPAVAIDFGGLRRREIRRAALISGVAHLMLLAAFLYSPQPTINVPRGVVAVELVAAPAGPKPVMAAPAPPQARPVAPPPPKAPLKKPVPKKVVLPAEPTTPKPDPKPRPRAKPEPVVAPDPAPAPPREQDLDDVLAQLREESGENREPAVAPAAALSTGPTGPVGSPTGTPISPEVAAWIKRTKIHVKRNWVLQPGFRTQMLEAQVEVDLDSSGAVRGSPRIARRSGNPWYDEGVVRAIQKSSPLPAPPEAGKWTFEFSPEDSY